MPHQKCKESRHHFGFCCVFPLVVFWNVGYATFQKFICFFTFVFVAKNSKRNPLCKFFGLVSLYFLNTLIMPDIRRPNNRPLFKLTRTKLRKTLKQLIEVVSHFHKTSISYSIGNIPQALASRKTSA